MIPQLSTTLMWDLPVVTASQSQVWQVLSDLIKFPTQEKKALLIATPNPEQIILAQKLPDFKKNLQAMDLLLPDGNGLVTASQIRSRFGWQGQACRERITGADTASQLLVLAKDQHQKVLVIGGFYHDIAKYDYDTANNNKVDFDTQLEFANGTSAYWCLGYKNISKPTGKETEIIKNTIKHLKPAIVLVAFGAPWQEKWLADNRGLLTENGVKVALAVGGAIDFLAGKQQRAPRQWQKLHLEWLWRLIQQPSRWRRQLALVKFAFLTFTPEK